ncbi:hypothetical protein LCGC14_0741140 [marine sediment metagenome]|uniref:Integrase catalytic domain-containing protein n=1 Tax=marine sediment metagenome TaxID=412755 RepID=A0A0F9QAZ7_9ZZZZ
MVKEIVCKYCGSDNVIKYGKYKGTQYYWCKDCKRKFANVDNIPKMQYSTDKIADVLNMYFEGMSLMEIRRNLMQQHDVVISDATAYNWVRRFSKLAILEAAKYQPKVGSLWAADETMIDLDGKNIWFWDIIDTKTRVLIASHMSYTRTTKDAQALMQQAYDRTGKIPRVIYTDGLKAYLDGIELTFGSETKHAVGGPFDIEDNTNRIERFHSTLKSRTKVMRGLDSFESARLFLDGWLVHYNFFRPHMSLNDLTPAQAAGIRFPFRNWKDIIEQPYEVTARIPVRTDDFRRHKAVKSVTRRRRKRTKSMPGMTRIRQIRPRRGHN